MRGPPRTSARRVSSATSARRCGSLDSSAASGRPRAAVAPSRSACSARPCDADAARAEDRDRGVAGREHDGRARVGEVAAGAARARRTRCARRAGAAGARSRPATRRAIAVVSGPKNSRAASVPRSSSKRASSAAARRAARARGSACATEPPTVPRARIAACPTCRTACASSGQWRGDERRALERCLAHGRADPQRAVGAPEHAGPGWG